MFAFCRGFERHGANVPASVDGVIYASPLPTPVNTIAVGAGGIGLPPVFAAVGAAGQAAEILELNFQAPAETPPGISLVLENGYSGGFFPIRVQ